MRAMKKPDDEVGRLGPLHRALGQQDRAEGGRVAQRLRGERAEEEQREVGRELRPLRLGTGLEETVLTAQRRSPAAIAGGTASASPYQMISSMPAM